MQPGPYRVHLDVLNVKEPCRERWDRMDGDDFVRFCRVCEDNVYDLSARSRDEAEELLRLHEGPLCVRFQRRADGTVVTSNCSGARSAYRRRKWRRAFNAALIVAGLSAGVLAVVACVNAFIFSFRPGPAPTIFRPPVALPQTARTPQEDHFVMGLVAAPSTETGPAWVDPSELHLPATRTTTPSP